MTITRDGLYKQLTYVLTVVVSLVRHQLFSLYHE